MPRKVSSLLRRSYRLFLGPYVTLGTCSTTLQKQFEDEANTESKNMELKDPGSMRTNQVTNHVEESLPDLLDFSYVTE